MWMSIGRRLIAVAGILVLAFLLVFSWDTPKVTALPSSSAAHTSGLNQGPTCQPNLQTAPIPYHVETRQIRSGQHTADSRDQNQVVFKTLVQSLDAPWLQIRFGSTNLGRNSYLKLTALSNGATQQLDAATLALWHNHSATFKGDSVNIELYAAPEDNDVFFEVESLMVGEWVGGVPLRSSRPSVTQWEPSPSRQLDTTHYSPDTVCGATDERVASNDPAVGRIVPKGCTGWVISNGAFLTAGHCNDGNMTTIQFNVPASNADGTINPPENPNDEYPIDGGSILSMNAGSGNDWAVFRVTRNTTTTLTPPLAYGYFYRGFLNQPFTVRVTGYGVDGPAPCFGESRQPGCSNPTPPQDATNQTQQTTTGPSLGRTGDHYEHQVDTEGGNSGSPVRHPDFWQAVAIHTHGFSSGTCITQSNGGTAFTNAALAAAINNFPGPNVRYVDAALPTLSEDGTVFRPFDLLSEGIDTVPLGGIVSIVKGNYSGSIIINKNLTLKAPVGTVVIGAP